MAPLRICIASVAAKKTWLIGQPMIRISCSLHNSLQLVESAKYAVCGLAPWIVLSTTLQKVARSKRRTC
eukprot:8873094-Lingulodinium_polyedra.AAC.1